MSPLLIDKSPALIDSLISATNSYSTAIVSLTALIVSIIVLIYTAKTYWLKSGVNIRGAYVLTSSIYCAERYISRIILENLKDRSVVIFSVHLKLGYNYFIEIDNFRDNPLILKPFEAFQREYDPIDFYNAGTKRIFMRHLFDNKSLKRCLVLSTADGKYIVKSFLTPWMPFHVSFHNYFTAIVRPIRLVYKGKAYGSNAKFIVEFKTENGEEEIVAIYQDDCERRKFYNFMLTKESLTSKEALEEFLYDKVSEDKLICSDIVVYELDEWRNNDFENLAPFKTGRK
jgi:hypothetical protein